MLLLISSVANVTVMKSLNLTFDMLQILYHNFCVKHKTVILACILCWCSCVKIVFVLMLLLGRQDNYRTSFVL